MATKYPATSSKNPVLRGHDILSQESCSNFPVFAEPNISTSNSLALPVNSATARICWNNGQYRGESGSLRFARTARRLFQVASPRPIGARVSESAPRDARLVNSGHSGQQGIGRDAGRLGRL